MIWYIVARVRWSVLVLFVVAVCAFLLTFVAPADPARSIAGPNASAEAVERIRVALGLDRSMLQQLIDYFGRLARGDLGVSYQQGGIPVTDLILGHLPATIELAVGGLAVALLIGVPLGGLAATRPGGHLDRLVSVLASVLIALPAFLIGVVALYLFSFRLGWLPLVSGPWDPWDVRALAGPAIVLGLAACPGYLRITRTAMADQMHQDYIRTARAKGLAERAVIWRHAFRNAVPPVLSQAGIDLGFFLGGVVVIESVFGWPGIGRQAVRAITGEDVPMIMGTLLVATLFIVLANLVVDVLNALIDPRMAEWCDEDGGQRA